MNAVIRDVLGRYFEWLRANSTERELPSGWTELTLPYLDRHNDYIQVYLSSNQDGVLLSDNGETMADLRHSGCGLDTPKRKALAETILNRLGIDPAVMRKTDVLQTRCRDDDLPEQLHALLLAIQSLDGLAHVAPTTVESIFREDVARWLQSRVPVVDYQPAYDGESGVIHHFDFRVVNARGTDSIIQAVPQTDRMHIQSLAYAVMDTSKTRGKETEVFALYNDSKGKLRGQASSILLKAGARPIGWGNRDELYERLAS